MPLYLSLFLFFIFIFLQCPHLYICIVCMYIWLNGIYLYLNVYCQCLMLTVCTKGLRVTQFQFSVCMYCTCGRIDNKADLTWLSYHFIPEDYHPRDMMQFNMGYRETPSWCGSLGAHSTFIGSRSACGSAAGGRHGAHGSVREAAPWKSQLCTVSLVFLTFANYQISEHNYLNNEIQWDRS